VLRRTLPQLALQPLRELRDLPPHLRAQPQLIRRRIRLAQHPPQRNPRHLRLHLQLQLHDPASRLHRLRPGLACHCGRLQHREAGQREHVPPRQRQALCVLLAHLQLCNVIHRVPARRKACARPAPLRRIVRAARHRGVPVVRQGSVRADRPRGSRNAREAVAGRVVATIKDRSEHSALGQEFPRPSQASRSMRASRRHADGRRSRNAMPKANASSIQFVHARA
jgi:hypothetical protein